MSSEGLMPASAEVPSDRQRMFMRYFTAVLIDLVVLNLFVEYSDKVFVDSFTTSLLAALAAAGAVEGDDLGRAPGHGLLQGQARRR